MRQPSTGRECPGNVSSRTLAGATTSYGYDTLNRLTSITAPGGSISYGYDAVGNRTSATDASGTTSYTYDLGDQLQSASGPGGTTSYGFDQNGNETSAGSWTYTFNLAGQLTAANNGTTTSSYTYDGDGNRLSATTAGTTTNYLWDTGFPLPELALERAAAAIGGGPGPPRCDQNCGEGTAIELASGAKVAVHGEKEFWYDPQRGVHDITRFAGVVQGDSLYPPGRVSYLDKTLAFLVTDYRQALKDGTARVLDKDIVEGQSVYWIRVDTQMFPDVADGTLHRLAK